MAKRIQDQLGSICPTAEEGVQRILHFLRGEFQTGVFARLMEVTLRADAKLQSEAEAGESYEEFLDAMHEIIGDPVDLLPTEPADHSVRGIALRFFEKFHGDQPATNTVLDKIEDTMRAEFGFHAFFSAAVALRHLNLDLQKARWVGVEAARADAGEIETLFRSLSSPRPGSPADEVYEALVAHEAAQAGKEFRDRCRADFEIHGAAPHQWLVRLDSNRPIDPNRPWEKPAL